MKWKAKPLIWFWLSNVVCTLNIPWSVVNPYNMTEGQSIWGNPSSMTGGQSIWGNPSNMTGGQPICQIYKQIILLSSDIIQMNITSNCTDNCRSLLCEQYYALTEFRKMGSELTKISPMVPPAFSNSHFRIWWTSRKAAHQGTLFSCFEYEFSEEEEEKKKKNRMTASVLTQDPK